MFSLMSLGHEGEVRGLAEAVRDGPLHNKRKETLMNQQTKPFTLNYLFAAALLCASATGWAANPAPAPGIYQFGASPGTLNLTITQGGSTETCELIMDMDFQPAAGGVNLLMANAIIMPGTPGCPTVQFLPPWNGFAPLPAPLAGSTVPASFNNVMIIGPTGAPCTAAPSPMAMQFTNGPTVVNTSVSNFAFATTFGGCQIQGFAETLPMFPDVDIIP